MDTVKSKFFDESTHKLKETWDGNDFGNWGFDMTQNGKRTEYYIHTTPTDEEDTVKHEADKTYPNVHLGNSHGCVHLRPVDRAEMMTKGFLQAGVKLSVKPYGVVGPLKPGTIDL